LGLLSSVKHHVDVARAALTLEGEKPKRVKLKAHELAFLPAALEITETPASPLGRALALTIATFFAIAVAWVTIGEVDIVATAQGKIIPTSRVKVIQPLESGVIRAIQVEDGQLVRANDVLVELNPTGAEADRERLEHEGLAARLEFARLSALLKPDPETSYVVPEGTPDDLAALHRDYLVNQWEEHQAKLAALDGEIAQQNATTKTIGAEIKHLKSVLPFVRDRVDSFRRLAEKKVVARLDFVELQQELADMVGQLAVKQSRIAEAQAAVAAAESRRRAVLAEFRGRIFTQLVEAEAHASSLEQDLIKAKERSRLQTLTAPVDGLVQQLAIHTIGGVVTPAQELMVIVPADSQFEIEAMVLNKDVGFVNEGQDVEIKVDSFPFTKYGTIDGRIKALSRDAVQDEDRGLIYPARVDMAKTTILVDDDYVQLGSGMAVTVEIKTGKRRLLEYLLAPLQRYQDESMRER
jgi:hemolysin D